MDCVAIILSIGSGAWSIGSVRASGAVGTEFEPSFCHSLLSGGPWQDLVSSVRLEPLTYLVSKIMVSTTNKERGINQRRRKGRAFEHRCGHWDEPP